ncbi:MAG TPA: protein kinase [Candidatus Sulfotelmatobacter sp.]|nr:protein kinase [Candidatus Sulfotelmatobacter sp.]
MASASDCGAATGDVFQALSKTSPGQLPNPDDDAMLGRCIGAYRIERRIGLGGMASVYLASRADDQFRTQVAIKILRADLDNAELVRRFRNERQMLAELNHPNIVKLLDGGTTDGLPYLVMEYVDGRPIDRFCDEQTLTVEQRLRIFLSVCEAVQHAHDKQLIHRDLKPNNILVTSDCSPKLLDFGIAKILRAQSPLESVITASSARHLTPAYASPEHIRGEPVAPATDVYSLGVVLYELLTGHRPYKLTLRTPAALERAICEEEPESPSTAVDRIETETRPNGETVTITAETVSRTREGLPERLRRCLRGDLDKIVLKALQKDPHRRYESAKQLAADIRRHLEHRPVEARASSLMYRSSRLLWRHKTEMVSAGVVVLVLAAAFGFSIWKEHKAHERFRAQVTRQRAHGRRSVAVLGFRNLSGRSDTAWLSTALSEMLATELSAGGRLLVISGEDVAETKNNLSLAETDSLTPDSLLQFYQNVGSDYVVVGSYSAPGNAEGNLRLELHVQDAALATDVGWLGESGDEYSLPDLMSRIGPRIRERLGVASIDSAESASIGASFQSNPEAARLYAEGLSRLRVFDAMGARDLLEKALIIDPNFALAHSELAVAWSDLGYESKKKEEAKRAFDLAGTLPREQYLVIQGRYLQAEGQWDKASEIYRALFTFFPDNLDYGLRLAKMQTFSGQGAASLETCAKLHHLPAPAGEDPRIDLAEAEASDTNYKESAEAARRAINTAEKLGARLVAADALLVQGEAFRNMSDFPSARASALRAKELSQSAGDRFGVSRALRNLGAVLCDSGDFANCKNAFEEGLQISHELGNRQAEGALGTDVAIVLAMMTDYPRAKQQYLDVIKLTHEIGEPSPYQQLSTLEKDIGQLSDAKVHIQLAIEQDRKSSNPPGLAADWSTLAQIRQAEGNPSEARKLLQRCLKIYRRSGDKNSEAIMLNELAGVELGVVNLAEAKGLYERSIRLGTDVGDRGVTATSQVSLSYLLMLQDDLQGAARQLNEAEQIIGEINPSDATPRLALAGLMLEQHQTKEAEALIRESLASVRAQGNTNAQASAQALMVHALLVNGNVAEAKGVAKDAQALAARSGNRDVQLEVAIEQARLASESGDTAAARKLLRDALRNANKYSTGVRLFEVRLLSAETEMKAANFASAQAQLESLEQDARAKGLLLIARKAAAAKRKAKANTAFFKVTARFGTARILRLGDHDNDVSLPSVGRRCAEGSQHPTLVMGWTPGVRLQRLSDAISSTDTYGGIGSSETEDWPAGEKSP